MKICANVSYCVKTLNIDVYKFFKFAFDHFSREHISLSFGSSGILPVGRFKFSVGSVVSIDPLTFFCHGLIIKPRDIPSARTMTHDAGIEDCPFYIAGLCSGCIEIKL